MTKYRHPSEISNTRHFLLLIWGLVLLVVFYLYFFQNAFFTSHLQRLFSDSIIGYSLYFLISCLRGFTLVPPTTIILAGLLFFSPIPLFFLSFVGVLVSSMLVYIFSSSFHLYQYFEHSHKKKIQELGEIIKKEEIPIIIGWTLLPIVPADLVCYVCGIFKVSKIKFLLGIAIGQGIYIAVLIFFGGLVLN